jgi:hypothetical protein
MTLRDHIEALRYELLYLGITRDHEAWKALDAAEKALDQGDLDSAGVLLAHAAGIIGTLSATAPAAVARRARHLSLDKRIMTRWHEVGKRYPSRRAFAIALIRGWGKNPPSERHVLRILKRNLQK